MIDEDNAHKEFLNSLTEKQEEAYQKDPLKFLFGVSLQSVIEEQKKGE